MKGHVLAGDRDRTGTVVRAGGGMRLRAILRFGFLSLALGLGSWGGGAARAQDPSADPVQALRIGKMLLESSCTSCHHHLRHVNGRVLDRAGWEKVVDAMKAQGAVLFSSRERELIVDYLTAKSAFEAKCSGCHPVDRALATRRGGADWRSTVQRMADMNPDAISSAEARSIADYLTAVRPAP